MALCGRGGPGGLLDTTEVNYRHVVLLREGELAGGSSPDDLHSPKVKRLTLDLVREKRKREKVRGKCPDIVNGLLCCSEEALQHAYLLISPQTLFIAGAPWSQWSSQTLSCASHLGSVIL